MKRVKLCAALTVAVVVLSLCCGALALSEPRQSVVVRPEGITDPATVAADNEPLVRADGQVLNWDAEEEEEEQEAPPAAFDASTWPDNEYTKYLPVPKTGAIALSGEDEESSNTFVIMFKDMDKAAFTAYIDEVKAAGYTQEPYNESYTDYGMDGFVYMAKGPNGTSIEAVGMFDMEVTTMITVRKE